MCTHQIRSLFLFYERQVYVLFALVKIEKKNVPGSDGFFSPTRKTHGLSSAKHFPI